MTLSKPDSSCVRMKWKRRKKDGQDRIGGARRIMYERMNGIEKGKKERGKRVGWTSGGGRLETRREKGRKNKIKMGRERMRSFKRKLREPERRQWIELVSLVVF